MLTYNNNYKGILNDTLEDTERGRRIISPTTSHTMIRMLCKNLCIYPIFY